MGCTGFCGHSDCLGRGYFKRVLIGQGLARYTVRKRLQVAKMFFGAMMKRGIIPSSPFDGVQVKAVIDESRNVYVS